MGKDLTFNETLLLTLFFSDENRSLTTRLVKLLFLFQVVFEISTPDKLDFKSYDYGPWAENLETLIKPLELAKVINETEESGKGYRFYEFRKERSAATHDLIKRRILAQKDEKNDIVKFFSQNYTNKMLDDLIQFVYIIKPEFTDKSTIKDEVKKYNKKQNQRIFIDFVSCAPLQILVKFFSKRDYSDRILEIFEFNSSNEKERRLLVQFLANLSNGYSQNHINRDELIGGLVKPENTNYKHLFFAIIAFLFNRDKKIDADVCRMLYLFVFKALEYGWPLSEENVLKYNNLITEFKNKLDITSFIEGIEDLDEKTYIYTTKQVKIDSKQSPSKKLKGKPIQGYNHKTKDSIQGFNDQDPDASTSTNTDTEGDDSVEENYEEEISAK